MERIKKLLDPDYVGNVEERALEDLRVMRDHCSEYELTVSYDRRVVQARMEILEAERDRRARGGSLDELVADLPRILGADPGRASASTTRVVGDQTPSIELHWPDGREALIGDATLANLSTLGDAELAATTERLRAFERELSDIRHQLHGVIDRLDKEIALRQIAGTA